jgi:2-oxo-3-hexenedioate decarboxylase
MTNAAITNKSIEALAQELLESYERGQMVMVPPSARGFDLNAAYEVEAMLKRFREARGHKAVGRKVGFANKAMLRLLKLETLLWAHMYDDTVHYAGNNSATLTIARPRSLKIEPEIVFGLKRALTTENLGGVAALEATEWLALGFEIIDCPFPGWHFQPVDFLASFGLHAGLVVGEKIAVKPDMIAELVNDLPRFKLRILKNGELVEEGSGKNSLRSPALCVEELDVEIRKRFPAEPLAAGELISTGTLTSGHLTEKGDLWRAEVSGLAVPALSMRLA